MNKISNIFKKFAAVLMASLVIGLNPLVVFASTNEPVSLPVTIPVPIPSDKPDLVVDGINIVNFPLQVNTAPIYDVVVKNVGGKAASHPNGILVSMHGRDPKDNTLSDCIYGFKDTLATGASVTVRINNNCQKFAVVGEHTLTAEVDPHTEGILGLDRVDESNESNNTKSIKVNIAPVVITNPDLVVLSAAPTTKLAVGSKGEFNVVIKNIGNADAKNKDSNKQIYITWNLKRLSDGNIIANSWNQVKKLSSNETATVKFNYPYNFAQAGKYQIYGVVDDTNGVLESNESNNNYQANFEVTAPTPKADLVVLSATAVGDLKVGSYNDLNIVVKNQGNATAAESYVSANTLDVKTTTQLGICYAFVNQIAPGQTTTAQIRNCKQYKYDGQHMIYGKIDEFNMVNEANETNNTYVTYPSVAKAVIKQPTVSWIWPDILRANYYLLLQGTDFGNKQGEVIFIESKTGKEIGKARSFYWSGNYIYAWTPSNLKPGQQYGLQIKTTDGRVSSIIWKFVGR